MLITAVRSVGEPERISVKEFVETRARQLFPAQGVSLWFGGCRHKNLKAKAMWYDLEEGE